MICSAPRRILAAFVLTVTLLSPSTLHAAPLPEPPPGLLAWLHDAVAALWTAAGVSVDEGGGLDPSGRPRTSTADNGGGLDPSGRPSPSAADNGGGLDPDGR